MKRYLWLAAGLLLMVPSLLALTAARRSAPPPERLGYQPPFEVTYFSSLEHRYLLSELLFYDCMFYYGYLLEHPKQHPDNAMLVKYVDYSTRFNPYNIDAYYFGQAVLTWDMGLVKEMNHLLERGLQKRTWDFYLPFFMGFNYSYFLNDPAAAARYYEIAARLNPQMGFLPTLVGRLYYEANKTDQAIEYLKVIYQGTRSFAVRKSIKTRIDALETISFLEGAVRRYRDRTGRPPERLEDLVTGGVLKGIPPDPYGGTFYYDRADGRVKTTSKMAFQGVPHERH